MIKRSVNVLAGLLVVLSLAAMVHAQDKQPQEKLRTPNPSSGYLGVKLGPVDDDMQEELKLDTQDGIVILELLPGSPAETAGLKVHDVVRQVDGEKIEDVEGFVAKMQTTKPDQQVKFSLMREGKVEDVTITLAKRPANMDQLLEGDKDKSHDHDKSHDKDHDKAHGDHKDPATKPN